MPGQSPKQPYNAQRGFNLIELVVVITVLGVLMAGTAVYITNSVTAYSDTVRRHDLAAMGRLSVERVSRELRTALPNSVRVSNQCLEFSPVHGGSVYLTLPTESAASSFTAAAFSLPAGGGTRYVVVYPYTPGVLYTTLSPGHMAVFSSASGSPIMTVNLAAPHRFAQTSPQQRFYVIGDPVSFCVVGNELRRYSGYGMSFSQNAPPSSGAALLAEHIQTLDNSAAVTPFVYAPGTLRRNAIVALDFRFMLDNEWIRLHHEIQIRNVL